MKKILIEVVIFGALTTSHNQILANMNHSSGHNHNTTFNQATFVKEFQKSLLLPSILNGEVQNGVRTFDLTVAKGKWEFIDGKFTETYGYNGPILGPILSLKKGEKTKINITNNLSEETTVHWHGGILSQNVDGVHNANIQPNTKKSVEFILNQPAATLWFHPHPMHKTASQVYKGLAGLIYLEDEQSQNLNIPKTYGVDDFPIIIQDKKLTKDGELTYSTTHMEKIHGKSGGHLMINGVISPYIDIPNGLIRLRIVNGSNATNYDIDLNGKDFYQIGSDGGLLSNPVTMKNLSLAPGERGEILIDSNILNKKSYLYINQKKALELRKNEKFGLTSIPKALVEIPKISKNLENLKTRVFTLKTTSKSNTINNIPYNMEKLNFEVQKGTQEIWEIKNGSKMMDMPHPFHVHGAQFRVIERNGKTPPLNEQGWKDTVNLNAGDTVKILISYTTDGITVYHCHILEHEEGGMMGQFQINN